MSTAADQTVLVIGGGVSGLLTAQLLAADGFAVTVVDRNERLGGCNARVDLAGCSVPAAYYSVLGLEPGSALRRAVWPADSGGRPPLRMTVSDHVFLADDDIPLAGDLEDLHRQLRQRFPASGDALDELVGEIRVVYDAIHTLFLPVTPPQRARALQVLHRYGSLHYCDHLRARISDRQLRRLLSIRAFASTNTASTVLAYLAKGLIDGYYRLPGAGAGAVDRLQAALGEHGDRCRLLPGQRIERLLFEDGAAVGARTAAGEVLRVDHVVLGTDARQLVHGLIGDPEIRQRLARRMDGFASGLSAITVIYALRPDFAPRLERFRRTARLVLLDVDDPLALLAAREAGALDLGMVKVNLDLDDTVPRLYAELDCSPGACFGSLGFDAMAGREEEVLAPLLDNLGMRLERALPGFGGAIRAFRVLTPHTYGALTGSRSGAGSGWRDDVSMPSGLERELAALGLVHVGQWSQYGSGLSQLAAGAQAARREIRRRARRAAPRREVSAPDFRRTLRTGGGSRQSQRRAVKGGSR